MDIGFRHMFPVRLCKAWVTDSYFDKYAMPKLNGTFLCFKMCAQLGTYLLKPLQFYTLRVYNYFMLYLLFYVMMMLFYLYICKYVTNRGPQCRIAYLLIVLPSQNNV